MASMYTRRFGVKEVSEAISRAAIKLGYGSAKCWRDKATATDKFIADSQYHRWTSSTCFIQNFVDFLFNLLHTDLLGKWARQTMQHSLVCGHHWQGWGREGILQLPLITHSITSWAINTFHYVTTSCLLSPDPSSSCWIRTVFTWPGSWTVILFCSVCSIVITVLFSNKCFCQ